VVEDLVAEDANHVEGLLGGDGVDQNITVNANEVFRIQDTVFILVVVMLILATDFFHLTRFCVAAPPSLQSSYLTSGVNNLSSIILPLVFHNLAERVFDGGVVAFDEMTVDELDSEGGLAYRELACLDLVTFHLCHTNGSAADKGYLALLWWCWHWVGVQFLLFVDHLVATVVGWWVRLTGVVLDVLGSS